MRKLLLTTIAIAATAFGQLYAAASSKPIQPVKTDTIFAIRVLPNSALLTDTHARYTMLIYAGHTYRSIKLLDEQLKINGDQLTIVQKLYDGTSVNTDSVIVNRKTLMPVESYSDISTSRDSFIYKGNKLTGTMTAIAKNQKPSVTKIDTSLAKPMFNGLAYAETYRSLTYKKGVPFYIAQYVPGHRVNFERVEYIKDDDIIVNGVSVHTKVLEIKKTERITIRCWLNAKDQGMLKMEGDFPGFTYSLLKL